MAFFSSTGHHSSMRKEPSRVYVTLGENHQQPVKVGLCLMDHFCKDSHIAENITMTYDKERREVNL